MTTTPAEPRNPFYLLLLLTSLAFVVTALGYTIVPVLEERTGQAPPPLPFLESLRDRGWVWLLYEVALMIVFGIASMGLDRYRRYIQEKKASKPAK